MSTTTEKTDAQKIETLLVHIFIDNAKQHGKVISREEAEERVKLFFKECHKELNKRHPFARTSKLVNGERMVHTKYVQEFQEIAAKKLCITSEFAA